MKKLIDILLNFLIIVFGIVLLFSIYTSFQTRVLGNDYGNFFGYTVFEVQTGSMADSINPSDWVVVKQTQSVKLDDVITYKLGSEYITHRIIEAYSGTYITKGDANNTKDDPVDQSQIVGKVVKVLPHFGIFRKTLLEPAVLIVFIITLLIINMYFSKKNAFDLEKGKPNRLDSLSHLLKKILIFLAGPKYSNAFDKKPAKVIEKKPEKKIAVKISGSNNLEEEIKNKNLEDDEEYRITKNNDLEKTTFFRVVSVDADEIKSGKKQEILDEIIDTDEKFISHQRESDLEKTAYFRAISIDADEINGSLKEIAQNQLNDPEGKLRKNPEEDVEILELEEEVTVEDEVKEDAFALTNIELDLLNEFRSSKSKNIIEKAIKIKKQEIEELMQVFFDTEEIKGNVAREKEALIETFINAKYYNFYDKEKIGYNGNNGSKIKTVIKNEAKKLIDTYKGRYEKYVEVINVYKNILIVIVDYEEVKFKITNKKALNEYCEKAINKHFRKFATSDLFKINEIMKKYDRVFDSFLEEFESKTFDLVLNKVASKKSIYALELLHNISFSKLYSNVVVDRIYNKGIVAEDKMMILLTLLSVRLVRDMDTSNFKNEYLFYLPSSLYGKKRKITTVLRVLDDVHAKNNTIILMNFEDLLANASIIEKIRKDGYRLGLMLDKEEKTTSKTKGYLYMFDYFFIDKKNKQYNKIINLIPSELSDRIIKDNVIEKIGDFGGER